MRGGGAELVFQCPGVSEVKILSPVSVQCVCALSLCVVDVTAVIAASDCFRGGGGVGSGSGVVVMVVAMAVLYHCSRNRKSVQCQSLFYPDSGLWSGRGR